MDRSTCEFLLDYEDGDSDSDDSAPSKRKKPWRLRWPDDFRDEVLARLLELNEKRAGEERRSGIAAEKAASRGGARKKATVKKVAKPTPLLDKDGG